MIEELANGNAAFVDVQVKDLTENQIKDLGHLLLHHGCIVLKRQKDIDLKLYSHLLSTIGDIQDRLIVKHTIKHNKWKYGDPLEQNMSREEIEKGLRDFYDVLQKTKFVPMEQKDEITFGVGKKPDIEESLFGDKLLYPMGWFDEEYYWVCEVSDRKKQGGLPQGLFGYNDIIWHTNLNSQFFLQYGSSVVLYGKEYTAGSITPILNCNHAYSDFDETLKNKMLQTKGPMGKVLQHADNDSIAVKIRSLGTGSDYSYAKYTNNDMLLNALEQKALVYLGEADDTPLVMKTPTTAKYGDYTFNAKMAVSGLTGDIPLSREILSKAFEVDTYRYNHEWEDGDIILFDQGLTAHARDNSKTLEPKKRILWRSCINHSKLNIPKWLDIKENRNNT